MTIHQAQDQIYHGAPAYALADWRRRINDLYAEIRAMAEPSFAHNHWLSVRSWMFRHHPMTPLPTDRRTQFTGIVAFPYNPSLRFEVDLTAVEAAPLRYELGNDGTMACRAVAVTSGLAGELGRELTVYWIEGYGGGLFLPYLDATSSDSTYGGGRYLIDAIKGADLGLSSSGHLILDFNFAYNPSCALNDTFTCPLPPEENRLPVPVRAGDRMLYWDH